MNYVALLRLHSSTIEADRKMAMERRAKTRYPDGVSILVEWWPIGGKFDVVSIISSPLVIPVMELVVEWSHNFEVNIWPAIRVDDLSAVRLWELHEESQIRVEDLTTPDRRGLTSVGLGTSDR
jgi:hypothetical protein